MAHELSPSVWLVALSVIGDFYIYRLVVGINLLRLMGFGLLIIQVFSY